MSIETATSAAACLLHNPLDFSQALEQVVTSRMLSIRLDDHLETPKSFLSQISYAAFQLKCAAVMERVKVGQFIPNPRPMLFQEIVRAALEQVKSYIKDANVDKKFILEDGIEDAQLVLGDKNCVFICLSHILRLALRLTKPEFSIRVACSNTSSSTH